jgi:CRISPR/Cas system-associated protein Cas7 (RAMP superfamily)
MGRRRIPVEAIEDKESLAILEKVLFKGKGHMCRGQGITRLNPEKLQDNKEKIIEFLAHLFA